MALLLTTCTHLNSSGWIALLSTISPDRLSLSLIALGPNSLVSPLRFVVPSDGVMGQFSGTVLRSLAPQKSGFTSNNSLLRSVSRDRGLEDPPLP